MLPLAFLLLLAAPRVQLVDDVFRVPAGDWRYVDFSLKQRAALVSAECDTGSGATPVRIALLRHEDLERLRAGAPHSLIDVTPPGPRNRLNYLLREPGDYALVIDNQARLPAAVHLAIWLDFAPRAAAPAQITPRRQLGVILISFAVFLAIAGLAGPRLLRAFHGPSEPRACRSADPS
jgi:hypothetical protein